jgi:hypothetical protein
MGMNLAAHLVYFGLCVLAIAWVVGKILREK